MQDQVSRCGIRRGGSVGESSSKKKEWCAPPAAACLEEAPVRRVVTKGPRAGGGVEVSVWNEVRRWCDMRRGEVQWSLPARRKSGGVSCNS